MTVHKVRCAALGTDCPAPAIVGLAFGSGRPEWSFQIDHFCATHLPDAVANRHALAAKVHEQSQLTADTGVMGRPCPVTVWPLMPDLPEYDTAEPAP